MESLIDLFAVTVVGLESEGISSIIAIPTLSDLGSEGFCDTATKADFSLRQCKLLVPALINLLSEDTWKPVTCKVI